MVNWLNVVRWVHILAGAAWLGEVVTVVFMLVPLISRLPLTERGRFVAAVFPRIFRLASVFSITTLLAGVVLNYMLTGWRQLGSYFSGLRGVALLTGAVLGLMLALFHFFAESRLEPHVLSLADNADEETLRTLTKYLRIIPRVGLGVIITIFLLMMLAARGV